MSAVPSELGYTRRLAREAIAIVAAEPMPRLSVDLPLHGLAECAQCGGPQPLDVWQEHDEWDVAEPIYLLLCHPCAEAIIAPHPRLYRCLEPHEPAPGVPRARRPGRAAGRSLPALDLPARRLRQARPPGAPHHRPLPRPGLGLRPEAALLTALLISIWPLFITSTKSGCSPRPLNCATSPTGWSASSLSAVPAIRTTSGRSLVTKASWRFASTPTRRLLKSKRPGRGAAGHNTDRATLS